MRIQFTDNNNTYTIETIKSFAKYLAGKISDGTAKPGKTKFIADFALTSYDEDCEITIPEVLSDMRESGWYGVKELGEIGFNSGNRQFAFDYYGGQRLRVYDFDEGFMDKDDAEWKINEILTDIFDVSKDNYLLLIQWTEDKCLIEDREKAETEATEKVETEAVECCPHCECENVYSNWDVKKQGYVAKCKGCGENIMLCDECLNADDNPGQKCDWSEENGCFRCPKKQEAERENYYVEFYDKDRSEVIMQSAWMTEENARRWFQSNFDFIDYNHISVGLIKAEGDEDDYTAVFVEKLF